MHILARLLALVVPAANFRTAAVLSLVKSVGQVTIVALARAHRSPAELALPQTPLKILDQSSALQLDQASMLQRAAQHLNGALRQVSTVSEQH